MEQRSNRARWRAIALIGGVIALAMVLGWVVDGASARSVASRGPLAVETASLVQEGQDLVFRVELVQPFSPGGLSRDGRSPDRG